MGLYNGKEGGPDGFFYLPSVFNKNQTSFRDGKKGITVIPTYRSLDPPDQAPWTCYCPKSQSLKGD